MAKKGKLTYVVCSKFEDFHKYVSDHPNLDCHFVENETFLEGRFPGEIAILDDLEEKWNGIGILDMVDRFMEKHSVFFEEKTLEDELKELDLAPDDLELGV